MAHFGTLLDLLILEFILKSFALNDSVKNSMPNKNFVTVNLPLALPK